MGLLFSQSMHPSQRISDQWEDDPLFVEGIKEKVCINDFAEQAVKLMQDFKKKLTHIELEKSTNAIIQAQKKIMVNK